MTAHEESDDQRDKELEALFRKTVRATMVWATNQGRRDVVMNALYDVLVGVGPHDGEEPE